MEDEKKRERGAGTALRKEETFGVYRIACLIA